MLFSYINTASKSKIIYGKNVEFIDPYIHAEDYIRISRMKTFPVYFSTEKLDNNIRDSGIFKYSVYEYDIPLLSSLVKA